MGYAEKRGDYWRGRYKIEGGKYGTVTDSTGYTVRFRTKREAEKAANDAATPTPQRNGGAEASAMGAPVAEARRRRSPTHSAFCSLRSGPPCCRAAMTNSSPSCSWATPECDGEKPSG